MNYEFRRQPKGDTWYKPRNFKKAIVTVLIPPEIAQKKMEERQQQKNKNKN
jgi:hypothetical protein